VTNEERGRIISLKIRDMKEMQEGEEVISTKLTKGKKKKLEYKRIEDSSEDSSYSEDKDDGYEIEEHGDASIYILYEDEKTLFRKLVKDWREDASKGLKNTVPIIKSVHIKKIRPGFKLLMIFCLRLLFLWD
jgi:hypothetical protein